MIGFIHQIYAITIYLLGFYLDSVTYKIHIVSDANPFDMPMCMSHFIEYSKTESRIT